MVPLAFALGSFGGRGGGFLRSCYGGRAGGIEPRGNSVEPRVVILVLVLVVTGRSIALKSLVFTALAIDIIYLVY